MAYASPAELATFMKQDLDTATATLALALAVGAIHAEADTTFATPSDAVKGVQVRVATRLYRNPTSLVSEGLGAQNAVYGMTDILSEDEKRIVRRANTARSSVYSVPLSTPADTSWPYTGTFSSEDDFDGGGP